MNPGKRAIGFGCMRLSTSPTRDDERAIDVIHAALDSGVTVLDTAYAYCWNEEEAGHNERLIAEALRTWCGDRTTIEVATKGGLRRPGGAWVPDGRARHLRAAFDASRRALDVDAIDLYQLHVVDPRTPLETSVRALARLQAEGAIRRIGLSNVTVSQIEAARRIAEIDAVQVVLGVADETNLRNGVAQYCRDHDIRLIAYRPFDGSRSNRLARDGSLLEIAAGHDATPYEIVLAWLLDLAPNVLPIPGTTDAAHARSIGRARLIELTDADRQLLDARFPAGRLLRAQRSEHRAQTDATGEVVLVMGMPAAGKSSVAQEFVQRGYQRLNRDSKGGRVSDLVKDLDEGLTAGHRTWVLDNTYPARATRNEVIECAWRHGVPVRCIRLTTSIADAQINAVTRLIEVSGQLPDPNELRAKGRKDHRYFGPDAQFRYERTVEAPSVDEGFRTIEERPFRRRPSSFDRRALILEFDEVLATTKSGAPYATTPADLLIPAGRSELLAQYSAEGWLLFAHAWRPEIASGNTDLENVQACFTRARQLLGVDIEIACCPHAAGPPVCWCRKPLPGLVLEFAHRHRIALERCMYVGRAPADRTLAERLGMEYLDYQGFFDAVAT